MKKFNWQKVNDKLPFINNTSNNCNEIPLDIPSSKITLVEDFAEAPKYYYFELPKFIYNECYLRFRSNA